MPTYEYICDACEHAFEEFQSITAKSLRKCPQCKKNKLRRLIGIGAAVIFKGSGFYETDYRSDSYKKDAKAEKDAASGKSDSKDTKSSDSKSSDTPAKTSDTKPAAKSEAKKKD